MLRDQKTLPVIVKTDEEERRSRSVVASCYLIALIETRLNGEISH
jgi:hypothetical protein